MHQILFGFDLHDAVPVDAVREMAPGPVLVVHCKVEDTVLINQADAMVQATNAEHWYIEDGCDHAQIYRVMPEEYEAHVIPFFVDNLQ